jgi:hypothetical protein
MFHGFSARVMAAAHRLGIHRLNLPTVPEDDGLIMLFFSQLADELDGASARVLELIDAEAGSCWGSRGRGSSPTSSVSALPSTWKMYYAGRRLLHQELLTAKRCTGRRVWTSPCGGCSPSMPALEHPPRRAPPAVTPPALESPAARKPRTMERWIPARGHPRAPAMASTMMRVMQRSPSKLLLDLLQKN